MSKSRQLGGAFIMGISFTITVAPDVRIPSGQPGDDARVSGEGVDAFPPFRAWMQRQTEGGTVLVTEARGDQNGNLCEVTFTFGEKLHKVSH